MTFGKKSLTTAYSLDLVKLVAVIRLYKCSHQKDIGFYGQNDNQSNFVLCCFDISDNRRRLPHHRRRPTTTLPPPIPFTPRTRTTERTTFWFPTVWPTRAPPTNHHPIATACIPMPDVTGSLCFSVFVRLFVPSFVLTFVREFVRTFVRICMRAFVFAYGHLFVISAVSYICTFCFLTIKKKQDCSTAHFFPILRLL